MRIELVRDWNYSHNDHPTPLGLKIQIGDWTIGLGIKRSMAEQKWLYYSHYRQTRNWQLGPLMFGLKNRHWNLYGDGE